MQRKKKSSLTLSPSEKNITKMMLQYLNRDFYMRSIGFYSFEWQRAVVKSKAKRKCINGARQSGKSTIVAGVPAHTARFFPGSLSIIGAPTEAQANETMGKVMNFIAHDPDYPRTLKCSTEEILLSNGSRIIVRTAKSDTFRGYSRPRVIVLDEASRIEEEAYTSGARPMLTDNPDCELILISTPFGQEGFFYEAMLGNKTSRWERYEIRSPYTVCGEGSEMYLAPYMEELAFKEDRLSRGIKAWYSPRHKDYEFQTEQLYEMKKSQYQQEYECMFINKNGQVFGYDEINRMFSLGKEAGVKPLKIIRQEIETIPAFRRFE